MPARASARLTCVAASEVRSQVKQWAKIATARTSAPVSSVPASCRPAALTKSNRVAAMPDRGARTAASRGARVDGGAAGDCAGTPAGTGLSECGQQALRGEGRPAAGSRRAFRLRRARRSLPARGVESVTALCAEGAAFPAPAGRAGRYRPPRGGQGVTPPPRGLGFSRRTFAATSRPCAGARAACRRRRWPGWRPAA